MKFIQGVALLACSQLAWAATDTITPTPSATDIISPTSSANAEKAGLPIQKRLDYDVCNSDCSLSGVAFPDKNTLQLPLENYFSERCPQIYIPTHDKPNATSNVCLDFTGQFLTFTFAPFAGYITKSAVVHWKLAGNLLFPKSYSHPPPDQVINCDRQSNGNFVCKLPFSHILGTSGHADLKELLHGMCPNGDREGLSLYLAFSGTVAVPAYPHNDIHFRQEYPCKPGARDNTRRCNSFNHYYNYTQVSYRCSRCDVAPCQAPYEFRTAYGYQFPRTSYDLSTQHGKDCKENWGWYETPTLKTLKHSISGPLYLRTKHDNYEVVGTWAAAADSHDVVKVKYRIYPGLPYTIDEVNVDLACSPIDNCNPSDYNYKKEGLGDATEYLLRGLKFPKCTHRTRPYLIVSAEINTPVTQNHYSDWP